MIISSLQVGTHLRKGATTIWSSYRPGRTEAGGVIYLAIGLISLAYSTLWRVAESRHAGEGVRVANQAIAVSLVIAVTGIARLTIPICLFVTYSIVRSWSWNQ